MAKQPPHSSVAHRALVPRAGPGILLAAIASAIVWRLTSPVRRTESQSRDIHLGAAPSRSLTAPDPVWLQSHKSALKLTHVQDGRLTIAVARWQRNTTSLSIALKNAAAAFNQNPNLHSRKAVGLTSIAGQAAAVSDITRQLLELRRAWWRQSSGLLTATQRKQAEDMWARRYAAPEKG